MVDPTKEVPAAIKAVRGGFMTLSEVIRQNGSDRDQHFEEIARDMRRTMRGLNLLPIISGNVGNTTQATNPRLPKASASIAKWGPDELVDLSTRLVNICRPPFCLPHGKLAGYTASRRA